MALRSREGTSLVGSQQMGRKISRRGCSNGLMKIGFGMGV